MVLNFSVVCFISVNSGYLNRKELKCLYLMQYMHIFQIL